MSTSSRFILWTECRKCMKERSTCAQQIRGIYLRSPAITSHKVKFGLRRRYTTINHRIDLIFHFPARSRSVRQPNANTVLPTFPSRQLRICYSHSPLQNPAAPINQTQRSKGMNEDDDTKSATERVKTPSISAHFILPCDNDAMIQRIIFVRGCRQANINDMGRTFELFRSQEVVRGTERCRRRLRLDCQFHQAHPRDDEEVGCRFRSGSNGYLHLREYQRNRRR